MSEIYLVSTFSMEPYEGDNWPTKAFTTKEKAEEFLRENKGVFEEGYFRWDEELRDDVPCEPEDEDATFNYGWSYFRYISCVEVVS